MKKEMDQESWPAFSKLYHYVHVVPKISGFVFIHAQRT